jgi:hypothetical protein
MNGNGHRPEPPGARCSPRVYSIREIVISYEGQDEQILVKPPNLSRRGMFVNTSRSFPEGAVLNLKFDLVLTDAEIRTRCEVRYCLPGVGIGVEFIGLSEHAIKMIEREIALNGRGSAPIKPRRLKKDLAHAGKRHR